MKGNKGVVQVTSRGCSRAYVLCVLRRALDSVRRWRSENQTVTFPFNKDDISCWLVQARDDCRDKGFQVLLGGIDYDPDDSRTFWTCPNHFFTWWALRIVVSNRLYTYSLLFLHRWKNNIERKNKFLALLKDAYYVGFDEKLISR